jgi:hypothetical protein
VIIMLRAMLIIGTRLGAGIVRAAATAMLFATFLAHSLPASKPEKGRHKASEKAAAPPS